MNTPIELFETMSLLNASLDIAEERQKQVDRLLDYLEALHAGNLRAIQNPALFRAMGRL